MSPPSHSMDGTRNYAASGNLAAEYRGAAPAETGTYYVPTDLLGSTRLVTRQDGTVVSRHDYLPFYLPFGEELRAGFGSRTEAQGYKLSGTALGDGP